MVLLIWEGGGLYGSQISVACRESSGTLLHRELKKKEEISSSFDMENATNKKVLEELFKNVYLSIRDFDVVNSRILRHSFMANLLSLMLRFDLLSIIFLSKKVIFKGTFRKDFS